MEIRDISGYEGLYKVSENGEVFSFTNTRERRQSNGRLLQSYTDHNGYKVLSLSKHGKSRKYYVHRLVAEAFLEKIEGKNCVDHIDCNPSNNSVQNLRWVTPKENTNNNITIQRLRDSYKKKSRSNKIVETMQKNGYAKYVYQFDINGNLLARYSTASDAQRITGISSTSIRENCMGKIRHAGGYVWSYKENGFVFKPKVCYNSMKVKCFDKQKSDELLFNSLSEAARKIGCSVCTIQRMATKPLPKDKYKIVYIT